MIRILSATVGAAVLCSAMVPLQASAACRDGGSIAKDGKAAPLDQPKGGQLGQTDTPQGTTENFAQAQQEAKSQNDKGQNSPKKKDVVSGKAEPCR
jgi:hypothetical protein